MATRAAYPKRRRRRPEEAEREILDAAEELVRELPWHEVTVERVMSRTTLGSREAFYAYFRDRNELIARLAQRVRGEIDALRVIWREESDEVFASGRVALERLVDLYVEHGPLLRALVDAARRDPHAERAWREFVEAGDRRTADRIREDMRRGLVAELDPDATARALCAMNREYLFQTVVGNSQADRAAAVETLHTIWWRTLHGSAPSGPDDRRPRRGD